MTIDVVKKTIIGLETRVESSERKNTSCDELRDAMLKVQIPETLLMFDYSDVHVKREVLRLR